MTIEKAFARGADAKERAGPSDLNALLASFPSEEMTSVSTRVGHVKNNDGSLIEPIAA
jgi:putative SOS response-associated peptidase YedK